jgi:hypothetical protein
MLGHGGRLVGHRTSVLCGNRGEFGGLGGYVAKHRPGLPPGLVDHLLELTDPALAELSGTRRLLSARAPAVGFLLVGARLLGARTCLVFRSHVITSNWGEDWLPLVEWRDQSYAWRERGARER